MDDGIRTHDPKTHGPADDAILKELEGNSPFDHLRKVDRLPTQSKPYNTLTTRIRGYY